LLGVFGLAIALRLGFFAEVAGSPLDRWHEWDQTDMATYLLQARQLSGVDWLASEPYHPYHTWQQIAPPEKWLEWYGPHRFHQAPAYAYAIALVERAVGDPLPWFKLAQLVLGAFTCVLAALLAGRLAGPLAAGATGVLAALYGPLFHLEAQLLREGPGVFGLLALTALLARFAQRGAGGEAGAMARRILGFAVPLGLFATFHEMASVLVVASVLTVAVVTVRVGARALAIGLGALALGYTLGFGPLLVRNLAVGAPAFSVSCRTQINFVHANEADAPRGGADFTRQGPSPRFARILDEADGSFGAAFAGVWRSYDDDVGRLLSNAGLRFRTIWHRGEIPDNTSYAFFRRHSAVLAWLPGFGPVLALAAAGCALSAWRLRSARSDLPVHAVYGLVAVGVVAALTLIHPVARFRLYLVPLLWIYAGVGVSAFVGFAQRRESAAAGALAVVVLAAHGLQAHWSTDPPATGPRTADYGFASLTALGSGDLAFARELADDAARVYPRKGSYYANLALAHAERGEHTRALADFERAYAMEPTLPRLREALEAQRRQTPTPPRR
jgi:hypothetical protein